jgi:hypothetical protein
MYTYKDVRQTFNPQAKTWLLRLSRFSQETFNGCRSRPPRWSDKEMFARYVNDKLAEESLTPEVKA